MSQKLASEFYQRADVVQIARELIGKYLHTCIDGVHCGGMIVETEAYCGASDRACHAYLNKHTARTQIFYEAGGVAYVYRCYGIHHLFNIITNTANQPDAILIRAIEPKINIAQMQLRRQMPTLKYTLTAGPGAMSQALGITTHQHYGTNLQGDIIWLSDEGIAVADEMIVASARVGIAYAGEDAYLPWRFRLKGSLWTSRGRGIDGV